jgi:outer membrane protein
MLNLTLRGDAKMKRAHLYVACLFILSLLVIPSSAFAFFAVDAGVGYWQETPSGTIGYKGVTANDTLDLKDNLNFDKKGQPVVRIRMELPLILPNIYAMYTPMNFEGTGSKNVTFTYGGQSFNANAPITSKVTMDHYDVAFFYPIPLLKTATLGKLNVDLGLNIKMMTFEGSLQSGSQSATTGSHTLYIPMGFLAVQIKPISLFSVEGELRYIQISDSHFMDYIGRVRINPFPFVFVDAGIRSEQVKIASNQVTDVNADIKFSGPFAEVGLHF